MHSNPIQSQGLKAVLYVRVSSQDQAKEGYSLDAQERDGRAYASRHGFEIVRCWSGFESAKEEGRKNFNEMLAFVEKKPSINVVLIPKVDRMTRNLEDLNKVDAHARKHDKAFHFFQEGFVYCKSSSPSDFVRLAFGGVVATYESRNHRERVTRGMAEKVRQGDFHTKAPCGYINDKTAPGGLREYPEEAPWVRKAFELVAGGLYSPCGARDWLLKEGCPKKLLRWRNTVERWISNPVYYGCFTYHDQLFQGRFAPLLSKALWDKAQSAIKSRSRPFGAPKKFPLAGLIRCECGCSIVFEVKKRRYVYGHCTWYHGDCGNGYTRQEALEQQIASALEAIQLTPEKAESLSQEINSGSEATERERKERVQATRKEISRLEGYMARAYEDRLEGRIAEGFWKERTSTWQEEKARLESVLAEPVTSGADRRITADRALELVKDVKNLWLSASDEKKRELVGLTLSNLFLRKGSLEFSYQTPFNFLAEGNRTANWWTLAGSNR